ncbi:MAG: hypothetical protein HZB91_12705 [Elusimicrobia bacterium]|nr:hypothetical protein [Elusimicrobiota bacterium]
MTGLAAGLAVSFVAQLAAALHKTCLSTIDVACVIQGLEVQWRVRMCCRGWVPVQMSLALPFAGLSASRWGWCVLAVHAANAGLVFALSRLMGLTRQWCAAAALLFFAVPGLADSSFSPSNLTEFFLLAAFLLVTIAYMRRARAATRLGAGLWLTVELGAVVLGVGNKESFIIYPALLAACEIFLAPGPRQETLAGRAMALAGRLLPHILLLPYVLANTLPWIVDSNIHPFSLDFSPGSILRQCARSSAAVTMPWLADRADPQSPPWPALLVPGALGLLAFRGGPALRFLALFGLILLAPVAVLGTRFDEPYAYHLWPALAMGTAVALSSTKSAWLSRLACVWLVLLAILWDRGQYAPFCATTPSMTAAVEAVPPEACSGPSPAWAAPRKLAEEHLSLRCRWLAGAGSAFQEAASCCAIPARDAARRWQCFGGEVPGSASMREEAGSPIGLLRQLLAIRCGRRDPAVRLAGPH